MSVVKRQSLKNTLYGYIGIFFGIISTLYVQPFFLTKEQIGITRLVISIGSVFAAVSCLGITTVIVRFFPFYRNEAKKHHHFFTIAVLFPLIGFLICLLFGVLFKDNILNFYGKNSSILKEYFLPITLITLFITFISAFGAYCNAINKSSLATFINEVVNRIAFIICILLFSYSIINQNAYVYSLAAMYLMQMLLLLFIISYFDYPSINLSFFKDNHHIKEILHFSVISSFVQITGVGIKFIDIVLIGKYLSIENVGIYGIAAFIGLVIETPLNAIEKIAGTKIARLFSEHNFSEIEKLYKLSSKYLMAFCGLLLSELIVCIKPLLAMLPNDYSSGVMVSSIIAIGAFFNAATGVNYSILTYSKHYRLSAFFYSVLLVLIVSLNLLLIPKYGITGAAMATCSTSIIHNLLRFLFIKVKLNMQPFTINSIKVIAAIILSIALSYFISIENNLLLITIRSLITTLVFAGLLIGFKVFSIKEIRDEITSIKKMFA